MSVKTALDWLQQRVEGVPQLKAVKGPAGTVREYPFARVYPVRGDFNNLTFGREFEVFTFTVAVEVHYPFSKVDQTWNDALAVIDELIQEIREDVDTEAVQRVNTPLSLVSFSLLQNFGAVDTYGPTFNVELVVNTQDKNC